VCCRKLTQMYSLRHHLIVIACFISIAFPCVGSAQQMPPFLNWDELAAHAGLVGLKPKRKDQFRVDVSFIVARNIAVIKAAILLTPDEWAFLSSSIPNHLLHPWTTGQVDNDTWKSTVDLILPFDGTVNVDRLKPNDKAVILRRPDLRTTRLYMLSPNADGKSGMLYYFYNKD
jgi:hypothetical protein